MSAQLGAPAILSLWASGRMARITQAADAEARATGLAPDVIAFGARTTCTGCPHLLHLPESRTARCAHAGLRKISDAFLDGDRRPSWCSLEERA